MNSPKVSILIPVYNTAQYLPRCLDSVLTQSLKELEVIAVNDASPDNSADILEGYAAKDPRVRIVTHEKNGGILAARVSGIRAANAPYVTFLDADDLLAERAMELAVGKAEETGADIVHFATRVFDESGTAKPEHLRLAEKKLLPYPGTLLEKEIFDQAFSKQSYRWTVWGKLYRTDLCRNAADILPEGYYLMAEDICFYTLISFYAHHYEGLDYPGYLYYLNAGVSAYQAIDLAGFRRRCSIFTACRTVRWFLESRGVFEKYQDDFRKQEDQMLGDLVHRWRRNLPPEDRQAAFDLLFQSYDPLALYRAFTDFFAQSDTELAEFITGPRTSDSSPKDVSRIGLFSRDPDDRNGLFAHDLFLTETEIPGAVRLPRFNGNSTERWEAWRKTIENEKLDAVVFCGDTDTAFLWDSLAIRLAGAAFVPFRKDAFESELRSRGLRRWLISDRLLGRSDAVIVPDADSAVWFRSRGCRAILCAEGPDILKKILADPAPEPVSLPARLLSALDDYELESRKYLIPPAPDGETFVPFFRKLDKLFRISIPEKPRKKIAKWLAKCYNKLTRNA